MRSIRSLLLLTVYYFGLISCQKMILQPEGEEHLKTTNTSFYVSCTAQGENKIHMLWKNDKNRVVKPTGRVRIEEHGIERTSEGASKTLGLLLSSIKLEDEGTYTCFAEIDGTSDSRMVYIDVNEPISFEGVQKLQEAVEGKDYLLTCEPRGIPKPTVTCNPVGIKEIDETKYIQVKEGLFIKNVSRDDAGRFFCKAGQAKSSSYASIYIQLQVNFKPELVIGVNDDTIYSFVSAEVNLTCEVKAQPGATFQWIRNGKTLIPSEGGVLDFSNDGQFSTLKLKIQSKDDFGRYKCRASNDYGEVERELTLAEGVKPGIPAFRQVFSYKTALDLNIMGPENDNLEILGYRIQYKEAHQTWASAKHQDFAFNSTVSEYQVQHLVQGTKYAVRVAAKNKAGIGDYSHQQILSTQQLEAEAVKGTDSSAVTLNTSLLLLLAALLL